MQLKTIVNRVTNYKSFVVGKVKWADDSEEPILEIELRPRANGRPICSICGKAAPGYDRSQDPRRFEFVQLWMIPVIFIYYMRRVNCPTCGIKVERIPWADGKSSMTIEYKWFLARWARRMSWKEVSEAFRVSWDRVYDAVKQAVSWGLEHRDLDNIETIGVDEVQWQKGHEYQTVAYQLDQGKKRLLWVGRDRKAKTLLRFFRFLGKDRTARLQFICSDMWQAYLKVIAKKAPQAIHILDRFHIMQRMNKALDKVRTAEVKQLQADGYEPVLKGARWVLLKRPANQTKKQAAKLKEILQYNLKSVRSHLMKEDFQQFWEYSSAVWAGKFLDQWCVRAMRSQIDPMKKVARMLRNKRSLVLNWFVADGRLSSGIVEGLNNKLKLITRKSYGFRTQEAYEIALYHTLGALPEPESTHEFC